MSYANYMGNKMATDAEVVERSVRRIERGMSQQYGKWSLTYVFVKEPLPIYHFRLASGPDYVIEFQITQEVVLYVKEAGPFRFDKHLWRTIVNHGFQAHADHVPYGS
ncbi:hypothetical protein [Salisediminibacterium beveridgei]|uniref:Uncharacterized protein n=1 Tax=Salisediminibacterium beveridgei TaxID=632773 RepID=A0A1D7QX50_9BACI|nr:hypothetical protein [Salisediminibacterium beveridgei]AOM83583.1 hypothetical protein BBEV_2225 [Salisediminibacterium beveridgei]